MAILKMSSFPYTDCFFKSSSGCVAHKLKLNALANYMSAEKNTLTIQFYERTDREHKNPIQYNLQIGFQVNGEDIREMTPINNFLTNVDNNSLYVLPFVNDYNKFYGSDCVIINFLLEDDYKEIEYILNVV